MKTWVFVQPVLSFYSIFVVPFFSKNDIKNESLAQKVLVFSLSAIFRQFLATVLVIISLDIFGNNSNIHAKKTSKIANNTELYLSIF